MVAVLPVARDETRRLGHGGRAHAPDSWHTPRYAVRFVDDATELNQARWDELARLHGQDDYYDVEGFLTGQIMLSGREQEEMVAAVGSVSGLDLLHVQCHFGLGTLSWARLGAHVTGLDFSPVAVERARSLATAAGIDARFVQADAQRLPAELADAFDVVFASYGVLPWIADVTAWMTAAATALRPGGVLGRFPWIFDQPDEDRSDDDLVVVVVAALGVAGRQRAPLLEPVEEPFDDVAVAVALLVELWRPAARGAAPDPVVLLVGAFGDRVGDVAPAQLGPDRLRAVALVGQDVLGPGPWPAGAVAADPDAVHDLGELGGVVDLAGGQDDRERPPFPIDRGVDLAGQPAAGPPQPFRLPGGLPGVSVDLLGPF